MTYEADVKHRSGTSAQENDETVTVTVRGPNNAVHELTGRQQTSNGLEGRLFIDDQTFPREMGLFVVKQIFAAACRFEERLRNDRHELSILRGIGGRKRTHEEQVRLDELLAQASAATSTINDQVSTYMGKLRFVYVVDNDIVIGNEVIGYLIETSDPRNNEPVKYCVDGIITATTWS